jgi:hypothetical protein
MYETYNITELYSSIIHLFNIIPPNYINVMSKVSKILKLCLQF